MLKKILLAIAAVVAIVIALALLKPDTFEVHRSIVIKAPAENITPLIADFHQWPRWSPWEKLDPAMQRSFEGPASGKGAVYRWAGEDKVGQGRMEITDAQPGLVGIDLDFIKPFASHNKTVFTLTPQAGGTLVNWQMTGPMPFVSKLMTVFSSMDKLVGGDFEKGLANMKASAEK